jgi:hypothetical protein
MDSLMASNICVVMQLLSGVEVIKVDKREIDIALDLSIAFELAYVVTQSASLSSALAPLLWASISRLASAMASDLYAIRTNSLPTR